MDARLEFAPSAEPWRDLFEYSLRYHDLEHTPGQWLEAPVAQVINRCKDAQEEVLLVSFVARSVDGTFNFAVTQVSPEGGISQAALVTWIAMLHDGRIGFGQRLQAVAGAARGRL